jgi:hypothetical protein
MFLLWVRSYATSLYFHINECQVYRSTRISCIACTKLGVELQVIAEAAGNCAMVGATVSVTFIVIVAL